mgnify:CR=1 FL=1
MSLFGLRSEYAPVGIRQTLQRHTGQNAVYRIRGIDVVRTSQQARRPYPVVQVKALGLEARHSRREVLGGGVADDETDAVQEHGGRSATFR